MKTIHVLLLFMCCGATSFLMAQTVPHSINYQGVARSDEGTPIANESVSLKFEILENSEDGNVVYSETQDVTTNAYGVFSLKIGTGSPLVGSMDQIDWKINNWIAVTINNNHRVVHQMVSVPYSFMAENVINDQVDDADSDASNELQALIIRNDSLILTQGNGVELKSLFCPEEICDLDKDTKVRAVEATFTDSILFSTDGVHRWSMVENRLEEGNSDENVFIGKNAGSKTITPSVQGKASNTFIGNNAGKENYTGTRNTFLGASAGITNEEGSKNTYVGTDAGEENYSGNENVALGNQALRKNVSGDYNTAIGKDALENGNGNNNTAVGHQAGRYSKGSGNVYLGKDAGGFDSLSNNRLYIENTPANSENALIYGEFDSDSLCFNASVRIDSFLYIRNEYRFPITDGDSGKVLVTDGNGVVKWGNVSLPTSSRIVDSDQDTKVEALDGTSQDTILFTVDGVPSWAMEKNRLTVYDNDVLIGWGAGEKDDLNSYNYNTYVGSHAGRTDSLGSYNTMLGNSAGHNNAGDHNTFIGYQSGKENQGTSNTYIGSGTGRSGENATQNTAIGDDALSKNKNGGKNAALGASAGVEIQGSNNVLLGYRAGALDTGSHKLYIESSDATGDSALIYGEFDTDSLRLNAKVRIGEKLYIKDEYALPVSDGKNGQVLATDGNGNASWKSLSMDTLSIISDKDGDTKIEVEKNNDDDRIRFTLDSTEMFVMKRNSRGFGALNIPNNYGNIFFGNGAGENSDSTTFNSNEPFATHNIALGNYTLQTSTKGYSNVAIGSAALYAGNSPKNNVAIGDGSSLKNNGSGNVSIGSQSLYSDTSGSGNVAIGLSSLEKSIDGNANVALGYYAGFSNQGDKNIFIGNRAGELDTFSSNRLIIENSPSRFPLIWGDFENDSLKVYGTLGVKDEYVFPISDGSVGQYLATNGNGETQWKSISIADSLKPVWVNDSQQVYLKYYDNDIDFVFGADSVNDNPTAITEDVKMFFVKGKAAFRAGYSGGAYWDKDSLGAFSFATGAANIASGYATSVTGGFLNQANDSLSFVGGGLHNAVDGKMASIVGGALNQVEGNQSTVAGGSHNSISEVKSFIGAGEENDVTGPTAAIVAGKKNIAESQSDFIGGGEENSTHGGLSVVGGGFQNDIEAAYSVIGGGFQNETRQVMNSVLGGFKNLALDTLATVVGGSNNAANYNGFVGGGNYNLANDFAAVVGGDSNSAMGRFSSIVGGKNLVAPSYGEVALGAYNAGYTALGVDTFHEQDLILSVGGCDQQNPRNVFEINKSGNTQVNGLFTNVVFNNTTSLLDTLIYPSSVPGGLGTYHLSYDGSNQLTWTQAISSGGAFVSDSSTVKLKYWDTDINFVFGADSAHDNRSSNQDNYRMVFSKKTAAFRAGVDSLNRWHSDSLGFASFSAGNNNLALAKHSFAGGGINNSLSVFAENGFIGAGKNNSAGGSVSAIVSGEENTIESTGYATFIGGGGFNSIENSEGSGIGSGFYNYISSNSSFIGSGSFNSVTNSGNSAIVSGSDNRVENYYSFIGGGESNVAQANYSTIAGGVGLISQSYSETVVGAYNDTVTSANLKSKDTLNTSDRIFVVGNGTSSNRSNAFVITKDGDATLAGSLTQNSDERLKKNIDTIDRALERLAQIDGVTYQWNSLTTKDTNSLQIGVIAQDVEKVFPSLVDTSGRYKSVNYIGLIPVLLEAIKELEAENELLKQTNEASENQIQNQEARLQSLEEKIELLLKNP